MMPLRLSTALPTENLPNGKTCASTKGLKLSLKPLHPLYKMNGSLKKKRLQTEPRLTSSHCNKGGVYSRTPPPRNPERICNLKLQVEQGSIALSFQGRCQSMHHQFQNQSTVQILFNDSPPGSMIFLLPLILHQRGTGPLKQGSRLLRIQLQQSEEIQPEQPEVKASTSSALTTLQQRATPPPSAVPFLSH